MTTRRSYHQFCGVARALDVVGERWTLLIVRELLLAPRRYGDLAEALPGITTNLLADRLKSLQNAGILHKTALPPPASAVLYALTDEGRALEPVVMALGTWGWRFMDRPRTGDAVNIGWALLPLKRRFRGSSRAIAVAIESKGASYSIRIGPNGVEVGEGRAPDPADLTLRAAPNVLRALFFASASAAALIAERALVALGTKRDLADFLRAFALER